MGDYFTFLQTSLLLVLVSESYILRSASAFCMSQYIVWAEVWEEDLALYKSAVGKTNDILLPLTHHCKYSLILHQNWTSDRSLKAGSNVKPSETYQIFCPCASL